MVRCNGGSPHLPKFKWAILLFLLKLSTSSDNYQLEWLALDRCSKIAAINGIIIITIIDFQEILHSTKTFSWLISLSSGAIWIIVHFY